MDVGGDNVYNVTVAASDGPNTGTQALALTVTNLNDNPPVITSTASVSVAENQTAVLTVTATDADGDTPTFSLSGIADVGLFAINSTTGVLTFTSAPDFENPVDADTDNNYLVTVTADDGANTVFQNLTVTVDDVDDAEPMAVTLLDGWVVDGSYAAQDATFNVSAGTNRIVVVALSAEKNRNGPISVTSVSLGDQVLTEVHDFTVGSSTAYHNLHWLGYLLESEIAARIGSGLTISYVNAPSNPFDQPKIHYASYVNVDQTNPIGDSDWNSSTRASSLQLGVGLTAGVGDKIIGFNVAGQHYAPGLSTAGYIEETQSIGATNGHASAAYDRTATTGVTENPTFTVATATRMAVSAVVLKAAPVPSPDELVGTEIVEISGPACTGRLGQAPWALPGNAATPVAALDATHNYITWMSDGDPAEVLITRYDGTSCSPAVKVNVTARNPAAGGSHDAPAVFVDGLGYVYVTYFGSSIYVTNLPAALVASPYIRRSTRPHDISEWEDETTTRFFNYGELNGFRLNDGAVLIVGSDHQGTIDIIEPGGSYRWPAPRQVVANDRSAAGAPSGCTGNRFTKAVFFGGREPAPNQTLYATWGWSGTAGSTDCQNYVIDHHEVYFAYSTDGGITWQNRQNTRSVTAPLCPTGTDCKGAGYGILHSDPDFRLTTTRSRGFKKALWADDSGQIHIAFDKSKWCDSGICETENVTDPGALIYQTFTIGGQVTEHVINTEEHTFIGGIREDQGLLWVWAESSGIFYEYTSTDDGISWSREAVHPSGRLQGATNLPGLNSVRMVFVGGSVGNTNQVHYFRRTFAAPSSVP